MLMLIAIMITISIAIIIKNLSSTIASDNNDNYNSKCINNVNNNKCKNA